MDDTPPTLEQANKRRLYDPSKSPTEELRRLNTHLLDLFVRLVNTLCTAPTMPAEQGPHDALITRIEEVFFNMQHLINLMRPVQAAMDLKALLDRQTTSRKQMTVKLNEAYSRAWSLVSEAAENLSRPSVQLSDTCLAPMHVLANPKNSSEAQSSRNHTTDGGGENGRNEGNGGADDSDYDDDDRAKAQSPPSFSDQMLSQMARIAAEPSL